MTGDLIRTLTRALLALGFCACTGGIPGDTTTDPYQSFTVTNPTTGIGPCPDFAWFASGDAKAFEGGTDADYGTEYGRMTATEMASDTWRVSWVDWPDVAYEDDYPVVANQFRCDSDGLWLVSSSFRGETDHDSVLTTSSPVWPAGVAAGDSWTVDITEDRATASGSSTQSTSFAVTFSVQASTVDIPGLGTLSTWLVEGPGVFGGVEPIDGRDRSLHIAPSWGVVAVDDLWLLCGRIDPDTDLADGCP